MNTPPPPPPPDVPALKEGPELQGTLRQRLEQHRSNPLCASCHERMDAIGFGLEHFDAIGAWRMNDGTVTVDASGSLGPGAHFNGATELAQMLAGERREQFVRAFAEKLLTYALGRGLEYADKCAVDEIVTASGREGHRFSAMILAVVRSVPFQQMRHPTTTPVDSRLEFPHRAATVPGSSNTSSP